MFRLRIPLSRTAALLSRLVLSAGRHFSRSALAEALWPDADQEVSRHRLRQTLFEVRRLLGSSDALSADRDGVRLEVDGLPSDVAEFLALLNAAEECRGAHSLDLRVSHLSRAVELYAGDLLPAFTDAWIEDERHRLRLRFLDALKALVNCADATGDQPRAAAAARRLTAEEPLDEDATLLLIRLLVSTGQPEAARREYERYRKATRRAGVKPTTEYRQHVRELMQNAVAPSAPTDVATTVSDIPPLATNLPVFLTRFFGRDSDIARILKLLTDPHVRLITLVGPGGMGKTRVSVETVVRSGRAACFASLAAVPGSADAAAIAARIGGALGISAPGGSERWTIDSVGNVLRARGASILILDNLEHLLSSGAPHEVIMRLLRDAPRLTVLATSRLPVGLEGEITFPLHTLSVSGEGGSDSIAARPKGEGRSNLAPAIALFRDRLRSVRPSFEVLSANASTVESLCRRLDGIPLALELAAGWGRTLTPEQMIERLDRRFSFLVRREGPSSARGSLPTTPFEGAAPERHRSLEDIVAWSYSMLPVATAAFFRRLAVFNGSFTAAAASAVATAGDADSSTRQLDLLCEHSLIVAEPVVGLEMRFHLLETLRDFAAEKLTPDERVEVERKHRAYYLRLASDGAIGLRGQNQWDWLEKLRADQTNFRVAFDRTATIHEDDVERAKLANHLNEFWWIHEISVGFEWTEAALAIPDLPVHIRGNLLAWRGRFAIAFADSTRCEQAHSEAARIFREIGDEDRLLDTLSRWQGNREALKEAVGLCSRHGKVWEFAYALRYDAACARSAAEASGKFEASQSLFNACGDQMSAMGLRLEEAERRAVWGEISRAATILEDVIRFDAQKRGVGSWRPTRATYASQHLLADLRRLQGDFEGSNTLLLQVEGLARSRDWPGLLAKALLNRVLLHLDTYELRAAAACIEERDNLLMGYPRSRRYAVVKNTLLSKLSILEGDGVRASRCADIALRDLADDPYYGWRARARIVMGQAQLRSGETRAAASTFHVAVNDASALGNRVVTAEAVEATSHAVAASGRLADAAFLLAFAAAERDAMGIVLSPQLRPDHDTAFATIRASLTPKALASATSRGGRSTLGTIGRLLDRTIPIPP